MIAVGRLAPTGQWDQAMLEDLINGVETEWQEGYPSRVDGCALLVPGRYWAGHEDEISTALARYLWVLLFVTSDEESLFDIHKVVHPNLKVWQQTPRQGRDYGAARLFGVGYSPHMRMLTDPQERTLNVFLSAQRTHQRRVECFNGLEGLRDSRVHPTAGFTQGMDPAEYVRCCSIAKVMPCPSGAVSVDSFRVWEALEAGALPVVDAVSPTDGPSDYWQRILGDVPFPVVQDWSTVRWGELIERDNTDVQDWYRGYKQQLAGWLVEDLKSLGAT